MSEELMSDIKSILISCWEYMDKRSDVVDGSYGIPEPNIEMQLFAEITGVLVDIEKMEKANV